jgi:hypothetical protein
VLLLERKLLYASAYPPDPAKFAGPSGLLVELSFVFNVHIVEPADPRVKNQVSAAQSQIMTGNV